MHIQHGMFHKSLSSSIVDIICSLLLARALEEIFTSEGYCSDDPLDVLFHITCITKPSPLILFGYVDQNVCAEPLSADCWLDMALLVLCILKDL